WATRLPTPDEVFGDNGFIVANLDLLPEASHNANVGLVLDDRVTPAGTWRATVNGFLRAADRLVVRLGTDQVQKFQNVLAARSLGMEGSVAWSSPGGYLVLAANATYQDFRNSSSAGTFGKFDGDRIPNRPYLFGNAAARLQFRRVATARDEVA